jgi:hypothetical protein
MSQRIIGSVVGAIILVFTCYPTPVAATGTNPRNHPPPGCTKAAALAEIGPCQDVCLRAAQEHPGCLPGTTFRARCESTVEEVRGKCALTSHRSSSITVF